jgi:salicylate hydroxylase
MIKWIYPFNCGIKAYLDIGAGLAIHANGISAMELLGEEVKRTYFKSAELSAKDEEEELSTDVLVGMGKNAHEALVSLRAATVRKIKAGAIRS